MFQNKNGGKRNTKKLKKHKNETRKHNPMKLLFVYGSLRKGFNNNHLLKTAKFIGNCKTKEKYFMVGKLSSELDSLEDGRQFSYPPRTFLYPYIFTEDLRKDCKLSNIMGELYEVDDKLIKILDIFEGHPFIFERKQIMVLYNNQSLESSVYLLNNSEIKKDITDNKNLYIPVIEDWVTATVNSYEIIG
jgi:gamma-glutamylaminecyclotransferase